MLRDFLSSRRISAFSCNVSSISSCSARCFCFSSSVWQLLSTEFQFLPALPFTATRQSTYFFAAEEDEDEDEDEEDEEDEEDDEEDEEDELIVLH